MAGGAFSGAREAARYIGELRKELQDLSNLPFGQLGDQLKDVLARSKEAVKQVEDLGKAAQKTKTALEELADLNKKLIPQGAHAEAGTPGLAFGELFSPEEIIKNIGTEVAAQNAAQNTRLSEALKDFADRIDKWAGDDQNYWSQLFNKDIPYLTKGARSAEEANGMIVQILNAYLPGMKNELLQNPNMPPEMRRLLQQLMQYAMSGDLKLDNLAKRFEDSNTAQKEIDRTVSDLNKQFSDANKFAADIGKGVERIEKAQQKEAESRTSGITAGGSRSAGPGLGTGASAGATGGDVASSIEKATGRTVKKIEETAAQQKQASQAIMDQLGKESDETRRQMKEADDRAKKDAEETRKRLMQLGDELLHGPLVPVATPLSDELERRTLLGG